MLRGILATCIELDHVFETEDRAMCICERVRELMIVLRRTLDVIQVVNHFLF